MYCVIMRVVNHWMVYAHGGRGTGKQIFESKKDAEKALAYLERQNQIAKNQGKPAPYSEYNLVEF